MGRSGGTPIFGLIFGIATVTCAFSGMLSMDPFPRHSTIACSSGAAAANANVAPSEAISNPHVRAKHPRQALEQLAGLPVKELELTSFGGHALPGQLADGDTRVVPMAGGPSNGFDQKRIIRVRVGRREGRITTTRALISMIATISIAPVVCRCRWCWPRRRATRHPLLHRSEDARARQTYNSSNWVNRWLYNGLHSLNFPWLYNYRPLWDIVVITLMLGGTALCVTSLVLAWSVLGRKLARVLNAKTAGEATLSEDLA